MSNCNTKSIVLKKYKVSDADLSVVLLTEKFGKINAWIKDIRTSRRKYLDPVDFFSILETGIFKGKTSNSNLVTNSKILNPNFKIAQDLEKFQKAFFILNILRMITEDGTGMEFFDLATISLQIINEKKEDFWIKEWFFFQAFKMAGYEFVLDKCANCSIELSQNIQRVYFSPRNGGIICNICKKNKNVDAILIDVEVFDMIKKLTFLDYENIILVNNFSEDLAKKFEVVMNKIVDDLLNIEMEMKFYEV